MNHHVVVIIRHLIKSLVLCTSHMLAVIIMQMNMTQIWYNHNMQTLDTIPTGIGSSPKSFSAIYQIGYHSHFTWDYETKLRDCGKVVCYTCAATGSMRTSLRRRRHSWYEVASRINCLACKDTCIIVFYFFFCMLCHLKLGLLITNLVSYTNENWMDYLAAVILRGICSNICIIYAAMNSHSYRDHPKIC